MVFTECFQEVAALENAFDTTSKKIGVFVEAVQNELIINKKEATLKVMTESGTEGDLCMLFEAASGEHNNRILTSIKKLIDDFIDFLTKMKDTVAKSFLRGEVSDIVANAEKACHTNPKLASAKVEFYDADDELSLLRKFENSVASTMARVKINHFTQKDVEELTDDHESVETKRQRLQKDTVTISLRDALSRIKKLVTKLDDECDDGVSDGKKARKYVDEHDDMPTEQISAIQKCISFTTQTIKEKASAIFKSLKSLVEGIKRALKGAAETSEVVKEGVEDTVTDSDAVEGMENATATTESEESKVFDDAAYLNDIEAKLFGESAEDDTAVEEPVEDEPTVEEPVPEDVEEGETTQESVEMEDYISTMEKELFGSSLTESAEETGVVEDIDAMIANMEAEMTESAMDDIPSADDLLAEMENIGLGEE